MGKSTINGQFSIAMLNYQRVYHHDITTYHHEIYPKAPVFFSEKNKQTGLTLKCRSWRSIPGFQVMCTSASTKAIFGGIVWNMIFHSTVIIYTIYIYLENIWLGTYNIIYGKYMEYMEYII